MKNISATSLFRDVPSWPWKNRFHTSMLGRVEDGKKPSPWGPGTPVRVLPWRRDIPRENPVGKSRETPGYTSRGELSPSLFPYFPAKPQLGIPPPPLDLITAGGENLPSHVLWEYEGNLEGEAYSWRKNFTLLDGTTLNCFSQARNRSKSRINHLLSS